MRSVLSRFLRDERGATAIEYAFIAGLISIAIVAGVTALGAKMTTKYQAASDAL